MEHALRATWSVEDGAETPAPRPRVAADWPLISDVLTHRAGVPEHLIRWRRVAGEGGEDAGPEEG